MDTRIIALSLAACAALTGLSGCKFGNHEIDPPGASAIQGYYESQMDTSIAISATKSTGTTTSTTNSATVANTAIDSGSLADQMLNQTITDPVYLAYDSSNGFFDLDPKDNTTNPNFYWIVASDNAGDLQGVPVTGLAGHLMPDTHPNCEFDIQYAINGVYGQPKGPFTTGTSLPLSGRIALSIDILFTPNNNDCSQLEACYTSAAACDAYDNQAVQAEFNPFIKAGLMSATDIPNIQSLEYQVSYQ